MLRFSESEEQYIYVSFFILFSMHIYIEELLDRLKYTTAASVWFAKRDFTVH